MHSLVDQTQQRKESESSKIWQQKLSGPVITETAYPQPGKKHQFMGQDKGPTRNVLDTSVVKGGKD